MFYLDGDWGVFLSAGQCSKIDAFLKHALKYGFTNRFLTVNELLTTSAADLYQKPNLPLIGCIYYYHQ